VAENRILREQISGRLLLSDAAKKTLAEIGYRLGRKALEDVANAAKLDTILGWYRKLLTLRSQLPLGSARRGPCEGSRSTRSEREVQRGLRV